MAYEITLKHDGPATFTHGPTGTRFERGQTQTVGDELGAYLKDQGEFSAKYIAPPKVEEEPEAPKADAKEPKPASKPAKGEK